MLISQRSRAALRGAAGPSARTKGYDTRDFVAVMRDLGVTPRVTQNVTRTGGSALDRRTTRHAAYAQSRQGARGSNRVRVVEDAGWLRKVKLRGLAKVDWLLVLAAPAFSLKRLPKLLTRPA
jgi:hypothetical protein